MEVASLTMHGVTKSFGGIAVLHAVDFDVRGGEVHALVGENGAGKSTLMKVAAGVHMPDAGRMETGDGPFSPENPFDALKAGIAMVHQELSLAPDLSVAENIMAGREPRRWGFVLWRSLYDRTRELLSEFGLAFSPRTPVSALGLGFRQVVEILKALAADPRVVIFDEATSSLEAHESALVLRTIRRLAGRGIGVVYITHRLDEVFKCADRVTVLRDGRHVVTEDVSRTARARIVNSMVGREMSDLFPGKAREFGKDLLRVEGLTRKGAFRDIAFSLRQGEILGFSGLVGAGRTEIMRAVFGADSIDSGTVEFVAGKLGPGRIARTASLGLAYVPEERKTLGLFQDRSLEDNIVSASLKACSRAGFVRKSGTRRMASEYCRRLLIKSRGLDQEVSCLSGGNQQKALLARWMATRPRVLIVDEPTRGVDIGAKGEIHRMLREYAEAGNGVIVVSSEMPEIIGLCDRVIVLHEGRIVGELTGSDITEERLIKLALGQH
jgi:ABC-type sugar transport system ATPase subunit